MKPWNSDSEVASPVGRPVEELLEVRPRRQSLEGFDTDYSDIVDYIVRCTHRIWEQKDIGLCRTHYADDCVMHTMTGPTAGVEAVVQGTINALASYPDRRVVAEDVIWSEDEPGVFLSSHRIVSDATHLGDEASAPASLAQAGVTTIADCLVSRNRIVEEWLVRDNLTAARQIGCDPWALAAQQADTDGKGDPARHEWRRSAIEEVRTSRRDEPWPDADHPARGPADAWRLALSDDKYGEAAHAYSTCAEINWPSGRSGLGRGFWIGCLLQLRSALHSFDWQLDHWAARPLPHNDVAVALRWSAAGVHNGCGVWGEPTGREVYLLAVTHLRLRAGKVVEETTVFDELAVLRQILGGLGA